MVGGLELGNGLCEQGYNRIPRNRCNGDETMRALIVVAGAALTVMAALTGKSANNRVSVPRHLAHQTEEER
jgi:hypothetical protein